MASEASSRIAHWRLRNQLIRAQTFAEPGDVVHWLGAVQAQEYGDSLWALGLRTKGAKRATIEKAIADRQVVRTWPMRGTLHFVAPNDAKWMLRILAPRVVAAAASRYRAFELDAGVFSRAERVSIALLEGGRVETRANLYNALNNAGIVTRESRGMHIVWHLAHIGLLCHGPRAGAQATFTLLDEWVPNGAALDRPAGLSELARRYFSSHGPAQEKDFAWWAGLSLRDARAGLEGARAALHSESMDGKTYWFGNKLRTARKASGPVAYLLPAFDEYTVAYRDRDAVLDPRYAKAVNAGGGLLAPIVVIDGKVAGTWKRATRDDALSVATRPFTRFKRQQRDAVDVALARYARFLGVKGRHT